MDDREFTRRLQDSAGSARPSDVHRRLLRLQLDHDLRRHHRPRRLGRPASLRAVLVASIMGALLLVGLPDSVGSDGFDLVATGRTVAATGTLLQNPILGTYVVSLGSSPEDLAKTELMAQERLAGEYEVIGLLGRVVGTDRCYDFYVRTRSSDGEIQNIPAPGYEDCDDATMARIGALPETKAKFLQMARHGGWPGEYHTTVIVAGVQFDAKVSYFVDPELGIVGIIDGVTTARP